MQTNSLLARLLLAAGCGLAAASQATALDGDVPAKETLAAGNAPLPAFSIDENGLLHGGQLEDQAHSPWNFNCVC